MISLKSVLLSHLVCAYHYLSTGPLPFKIDFDEFKTMEECVSESSHIFCDLNSWKPKPKKTHSQWVNGNSNWKENRSRKSERTIYRDGVISYCERWTVYTIQRPIDIEIDMDHVVLYCFRALNGKDYKIQLYKIIQTIRKYNNLVTFIRR